MVVGAEEEREALRMNRRVMHFSPLQYLVASLIATVIAVVVGGVLAYFVDLEDSNPQTHKVLPLIATFLAATAAFIVVFLVMQFFE